MERQAFRNQSARALLWLSGILVLLGIVMISPAGRMVFAAIAAICAGVAILLGRGLTRTIGLCVALATLILAAASYPAYKKHMDLYMERVEEQSGRE